VEPVFTFNLSGVTVRTPSPISYASGSSLSLIVIN